MRPGLGVPLAAALAAFCIVQDRVTADGARRYVALQREALAGGGAAVTVDEVMQPAVDRSVRQGLLAAGIAGAAGMLLVLWRRPARSGPTGA